MRRVFVGTVFALVLLWILGSESSRSQNHWRSLVPSPLTTAAFRSPYPWVEVVRKDGMPGYFIYAPVDQVPSDWPHWRLVSQHVCGFWQFVLADKQPAPEDARFECQGGVIWDFQNDTSIHSLHRVIEIMTTPDQSGPSDFNLTPAGQVALDQIPPDAP